MGSAIEAVTDTKMSAISLWFWLRFIHIAKLEVYKDCLDGISSIYCANFPLRDDGVFTRTCLLLSMWQTPQHSAGAAITDLQSRGSLLVPSLFPHRLNVRARSGNCFYPGDWLSRSGAKHVIK